MSSENEKNGVSAQLEQTENPIENNEETTVVQNETENNKTIETVAEKAEEIDEDFISEFSPEPIKIPNYNKEKAMKKQEKENAKKKKKNSRKSKKRRRAMMKVITVLKNIMLFFLLFVVITTTLSVLIVKINTAQYSVENAIRSHNPQDFEIGKIKDPYKINMKESSSRASIADVLRDNAMITTTYSDIKTAVMKSSFPDAVANKAHEIIEYYLYGKPFKNITALAISNLLTENVSYIKIVTGQELGETACNAIARYAISSPAMKELREEKLARQPIAKLTSVTSIMLSMTFLIGLLVSLLVLLLATVFSCKGFFHKMFGWACMLSGIVLCSFVAAGKMFFGPLFKTTSSFVKCVTDAISRSFEISILVYGALAVVFGLLIMLVGHAMTERDDDEDEDEEEIDYIDEIEQVDTKEME